MIKKIKKLEFREGGRSPRLLLPTEWVELLNLSQSRREVQLTLHNNSIIITPINAPHLLNKKEVV